MKSAASMPGTYNEQRARNQAPPDTYGQALDLDSAGTKIS